MKKFLTALAVLVSSLGLTLSMAGPAEAAVDLKAPFSREPVARGAVDGDPYHIAHVYDLQYRLFWLGYLKVRPNGSFGPKTERATKRFQASIGVRRTGRVGARTWAPLIKKTVRGKGVVPDACRSRGWHLCYDRSRHQANLYRNGNLLNSWLVRGGSASTKTRTGTFQVGWRDIDHTSGQFGGAPMPYSQFFSGGQALHGSRSMMDPWIGHSHGCVNFWVEDARQLWSLTHNKRLLVHNYGAWD